MNTAMNRKSVRHVLLLGLALGLLLTLDGVLIFIGCIFALTLYVLQKYFRDKKERNYVIAIFILGFLLRAVLCVGAHIYNEIIGNLSTHMSYTGNCIFGDSAFIYIKAQGLADIWNRRIDPTMFFPFIEKATEEFHYYVYAFFCYLFGNHELSIKFINIMYGLISSIMIYLIAKELFNKRVAQISYAFVMFFPSLVLWSLCNLKEPVQILLFSVWIYSLIMIRRYPRRKAYFCLLLLSLSFIFATRSKTVMPILAGAVIGFFLSSTLKTKKMIILAVLVALTAGMLYCYTNNIDIILISRQKAVGLADYVMRLQARLYWGQGHNYKIYPERFYEAMNLSGMHMKVFMVNYVLIAYFALKAIILFLVVPLPGMIISLNQAVFFPQLLLWYAIIAFSVIGFAITVYKNNKPSYFMSGFILALITPLSMVSCNVGTVVRHRDLFTPFFIIYASYGFWWLFERSK